MAAMGAANNPAPSNNSSASLWPKLGDAPSLISMKKKAMETKHGTSVTQFATGNASAHFLPPSQGHTRRRTTRAGAHASTAEARIVSGYSRADSST
jgi:hypothetical protein